MVGGVILKSDIKKMHQHPGSRFWEIRLGKSFRYMMSAHILKQLKLYYEEIEQGKKPVAWRESSSSHCQDGSGQTVLSFHSIPIEGYNDEEKAQAELQDNLAIDERARQLRKAGEGRKSRKTKKSRRAKRTGRKSKSHS